MRNFMTFCNEREGGCAASLTATDFDCGYCTNCGKETDMSTQMRFHMSNGREMVEHTEREALRLIRRNDPRFRNRRITEILQMRPSLIKCGVVYEVDSNPPRAADRIDENGVRYFSDHNGVRVDYPTGTRFRDGYVQPGSEQQQ